MSLNASIAKAEKLLTLYRKKGLMLAAAESCTGGLLTMLLTEVPGSSDVVERSFVTYSNASKTELLGVDAALIRKYGAVSAPVAEAMAMGALSRSHAKVAVSITGVAGPGASEKKPAGLVYIAVMAQGRRPVVVENHFSGGRSAVRRKSAEKALSLLRKAALSLQA